APVGAARHRALARPGARRTARGDAPGPARGGPRGRRRVRRARPRPRRAAHAGRHPDDAVLGLTRPKAVRTTCARARRGARRAARSSTEFVHRAVGRVGTARGGLWTNLWSSGTPE